MQRVILGDNQFFGINHMSEERARAQQIRFQDTNNIIRVLDIAYEEGVRAFMCTTHARVQEICTHVRQHPDRYSSFEFYPCMPYAHKYADAVTEAGMLGALRRFMPSNRMVAGVLRGGVAVASKDFEQIARLLIAAEMKMFEGLYTPVIFLQNVVTDLLLGLGAVDGLRIFYDIIADEYGAEPGFITMNAPALLPALEKLGIENPIVCCNVNKIGFRMCGGRRLYEETLAQRPVRTVAMSVLASGAVPPEEALEYVCSQEGIDAIVFGASSRAHIRQTVALISGHWSGSGIHPGTRAPSRAERPPGLSSSASA